MINEFLRNHESHETVAKAVNPYGDGRTSERIVQDILHRFELGERLEEFDI